MKPKRMIQVGTGGFGQRWVTRFLPDCVAAGLVEVVAAVDVSQAALANARDGLGLAPERLYTDLARALDENPADFLTVVVPPAFHEGVVEAALAHGLDILSEKPIADSLEAAVRVTDKVGRAGRKMAVTMSHRFEHDKTLLRELVRDPSSGALDYLVLRFTSACRHRGDWGEFRHTIADPMLIEGSVHHFDILEDLAGAPCEMVFAQTWQPAWAEYAGDCNVLCSFRYANGVRALYEGTKSVAASLNNWEDEYLRAECENATLVLDRQRVIRHGIQTGNPYRTVDGSEAEAVAPLQRPRWGHRWLIEKFVAWLDGGEPVETNVTDNLRSLAIVFAAIQSSRTGLPVQPARMLAGARRSLTS